MKSPFEGEELQPARPTAGERGRRLIRIVKARRGQGNRGSGLALVVFEVFVGECADDGVRAT